MRRRHDGDWLFRNVDAVTKAGLVNIGKTIRDELGGFVGDIEQDMVGAALFHFAVDGARDHVARRERFERMILHELDALDALEHSAFAPHCFADEK